MVTDPFTYIFKPLKPQGEGRCNIFDIFPKFREIMQLAVGPMVDK